MWSRIAGNQFMISYDHSLILKEDQVFSVKTSYDQEMDLWMNNAKEFKNSSHSIDGFI